MKKRILFLTLLIFFSFFTNETYARTYSKNAENVGNTKNTQNEMKEQMQNFGIGSFLKETEKYKGDFFEGVDLNDIFENAISGNIDNSIFLKKIINVCSKEIARNLKTIFSILIIIIIHSILKSISESLENDNISKLIYYVQYILILTIIMTSFSDIIELVKETSNNLVGFINLLIPILTSLMLFTGSITTSNIIEPILLFTINLIGNLIQDVLIPIVLLFASLSIISKISDKVQIGKLSKMMKSSVVWGLGIILTIFVGIVSLEGTLSSTVDGITAKTTKAIVSSAIPVVGKILGDTVDTVLGCSVVIKNALGIVGVIIVIGICIVPILRLSVLTLSYKLVSSVTETIADKKIVELLNQLGDVFKLLLGILCALSVMLIIGITLVIKISNSGMMYR